ncbi:MAG: MerR family transcriptional regulator [Syntrophaceae bacterium]|nr:MerR family transcriptional regulator [Syntrophaceae bacterium]
MGITIKGIVQEMTARGYKVTARTIRHYLEMGLLPEPIKKGTYLHGVSLIFPEPEEALSAISRIYELKAKGYKLADIQKTITSEKWENAIVDQRHKLSKYIEVNGKYYREMDSVEDRYMHFVDVWDAIHSKSSIWSIRKLALPKLPREVIVGLEEKGIFQPTEIYKGKQYYDKQHYYIQLIPCIGLVRDDFNIDFLASLFNQHQRNLDKYVYWPEVDNIRYSIESINYMKRSMLNWFGFSLSDYLGFLNNVNTKRDFKRYEEAIHDIYPNTEDFIDNFLKGNCAFVPWVKMCSGLANLDMYLNVYLKKFD